MSKYLTPEHPSFCCDQAWFLFAVKNHRGPGLCRLILVEAKSHAAVAFIERVSTGDGEPAVSATVLMMSIHRQCSAIGIRSSLIEEIDFKSFANDMVDRPRVDRDPLAVQAYMEAVQAPRPSLTVPPPPPTRAQPAAPNRPLAVAARGANYEEVMRVLRTVGFGDQAPTVLAGMGDIEGRSTGEVLQQAIDLCRSATG